MAARLILNADDFGLTRGINRAVGELHAAGVLTSATMMANGGAFEDAVKVAQAHPGLGVGCHVVLTDGVPVSAPEAVPTLLGRDGLRFRPQLGMFVCDLLLGRIREAEIECEARAQVRKLQRAGIRVTHLDTHKHTHLFPAVTRALVRVMQSEGVDALRNPFEPAHRSSPAGLLRRLQIVALSRFKPGFERAAGAALRPEGTFGISATGELDAVALEELLRHLPGDGCYELLCHPGYNDAELDSVTTRLRAHREVEREALLAVVPRILALPNAPRLIHYGAFAASKTFPPQSAGERAS